ncbi:uncharacterized protein LOC142555315 [Primulina tabacum]|uniref:uncharacterized protein LOC142555315 n=1 Tax=Primulina tabacum TaxID=48773 RepID=UPI003F5AB674
MRDTIDPISLADIDDSNEWLMGELNYNSGDENDLVFDDDSLTWGEVGRASGVDEYAYNFRSRGPSSTKEAPASTSTLNTYKRRSTIHRYNNEDDGEIDFGENDEESEGYKSGASASGDDDDDTVGEDEDGFDDLDF